MTNYLLHNILRLCGPVLERAGWVGLSTNAAKGAFLFVEGGIR